MTTKMTDPRTRVVGGVDTHKDVHVVAAIDGLGRLLGTTSFPADAAGYRGLLGWLRAHGAIDRVGVEGCGCWGSGVARHLETNGITVIEVNRPNRQRRRRRGKSDTVDAENAARAVLADDATAIPKTMTGPIEAIRVLRVARRGARKAREQAGAQFQDLVVTAPEPLRVQLSEGKLADRMMVAARFRPGNPHDVAVANKLALRSVARRWLQLDDEVADLDAQLKVLVHAAAPALVRRRGMGTDTVGALLVAAGDNPGRLDDKASFAALCGVSPVEASSGKTVRHRLNRGGNREANAALWRIVLVRMGTDAATKAYVERRVKEGKSKRAIMRCLKRYVVREVFSLLPDQPTPQADVTVR